MTRLFLFVAIGLILSACSANPSADHNSVDTTSAMTATEKQTDTPKNTLADTTKVKAWLTHVIESYTNNSSCML